MTSSDTNPPPSGGPDPDKSKARAFVAKLGAAPPPAPTSAGSTAPPNPSAGGAVPDPRIAALLTKLKKLKLDPALSPAAMKSLDRDRAALKTKVAALTEHTAVAISTEVDELERTVSDRNIFARSFAAVTASVATTHAAFKTVQTDLTQSQLTAFRAKLEEIDTRLNSAKTKADLDSIERDAAEATTNLNASEQFGKELVLWRKEKLVLVTYVTVDKTKATEDYERILTETVDLADKMDFVGARAKMLSFDSLPSISGPEFVLATTYAKALLDFQTNHMKDWDKLIEKDFGNSGSWSAEYGALKKKAAAGNFAEAITDLAAITSRTTGMTKAFDKRAEYKELEDKKIAEVVAAVTQMEARVVLKDAAGALTAISALDTPTDQSIPALLKVANIRNTAPDGGGVLWKKLFKSGPDETEERLSTKPLRKAKESLESNSSYLQTLEADPSTTETRKQEIRDRIAQAEADIIRETAAAIQQADNAIDAARPNLTAAAAFDKIYTEVVTLLARNPALATDFKLDKLGFGPKQLKKIKTKDIVKKTGELTLIRDNIRHADRHLKRHDTVTAIHDALAALPAEQALCRTALDGATAKKVGKRWNEAADQLDQFLDTTNHEALLAELRSFEKARLQAKKSAQRALKFVAKITGPGKATLEALVKSSLKDAEELGTQTYKYAEANVAFGALAVLLKDVQSFAAAYAQAVYVAKAVEKGTSGAAAGFSGKLDQIAADADKNLATAQSKLKQLLDTLSAEAKKVSEKLETDDAVNSNAGHSLARHGPKPDVTDAQLLTRLKTGVAPDSVTSFCVASSAFDSTEDWLAGREMALEEASKQDPPLNISATNLAVGQESYEIIVDHGRPIDKAFIGLKPNVEADADGTVKQARTFETYVETDGITKAKVGFVFQYDKPDSLPENVRDRADYVARYKVANGLKPEDEPVGATYAGRWVMMQQFPLVDGWNPETKEYDE